MIRILHEVASLDGGGVDKLLHDYYGHMEDREEIQYDFMIFDYPVKGIYEDDMLALGCQIYRVPEYKKDKKGYKRAVAEIIRNGKYDIVHSHRETRGIFTLLYGKRYGVPVRIIHSHIAYEDVGRKAKMLNRMLATVNRRLATDLFACGTDAGNYMWGRKNVQAGRVYIMHNAIDTTRFLFSEELRKEKREELGITNEVVIGNVGRLTRQKNQGFLIRAFAEAIKKKDNMLLVLVGRGEDEVSLRVLAKELGIESKVKFLGIRDDVPALLNAFDMFALPSLYEGLPVSLIEAQAGGLQIFASDTITKEVAVTDRIQYLSIDSDVNRWVDALVCATGTDLNNRGQYAKQIADAGYDIQIESQRMKKYYQHLVELRKQ